MLKVLLLISINLVIVSNALQCSVLNNNYRLDCFPGTNSNQNDCLARGCCWSPPETREYSQNNPTIPYCFFPIEYPNYQINSFTPTDRGFKARLTKQQKSFLRKEILNLNFEVIFETNTRLRIRITDPNVQRFEVPIQLGSPDPTPPSNIQYKFTMPTNGSFGFEVKRNSDGLSLFKTFGPLLYSDQFIQISSLMSIQHVYGIGEQNRPFLHDLSTQWERIGLWSRDYGIDTYNNLYGTHPFYMSLPDSGEAFGVYYFNSNAQEFVLQPAPAITYRTIGGILDIFIFSGGTPETTVSQYTELIGRPMLPPFWSLGFHLSKYGQNNIADVSNTLYRNINISIPIEVQWSDIDYMDKYKDFTSDPIRYPNFGSFVAHLNQSLGIKYIVIIDPGISIQSPGVYSAYDEGLELNIFIKDANTKKDLISNVWPGETCFPDFTHPNASKYWSHQIQRFHSQVPIDGLWIDMNEPASFYYGSHIGCPGNNPYDYPFFVPTIRDSSLITKTICSSSLHYNNVMHYNLHNLYGYTEAVATHSALLNTIPNKRPFILSRSTFSGSGKYTFHWTGDNWSHWDQLANSIRQLLNFNMFGMPMVGEDICGFNDNCNEELCIRWMQLGAFYPFMRNHNTYGVRDQDPASWSKEAQNIMRKSINLRYVWLPNFYTLLVKSYLYGGTVMRPLSFQFYDDVETREIERQFMIGSSMLVNPVVVQGARNVVAYFPSGVWYDGYTNQVVHSGPIGKWISLDAPIDKLNYAIRGGSILTGLFPAMTTTSSRNGPCFLYCALSLNRTASGELYWDDGESFDSYSGNKYSYITFTADSRGLKVTPQFVGFRSIPLLASISVVGLENLSITKVSLNGKEVPFIVLNNCLIITTGKVSMSTDIHVTWL